MAVSREDVLHIAQLARLAVPEATLPELTDQLNGILGHMEVLRKVDTEKVFAAAGVGDAGMPLRQDSGPQHPLERPLEGFAPSMRDGLLIVPRLATHESADPGINPADLDDEREHEPGLDEEQTRSDER
jgi:aspartyl-tRNA(Asn)/glutamyl-tRNA(Gln) amidotransferase subunit C